MGEELEGEYIVPEEYSCDPERAMLIGAGLKREVILSFCGVSFADFRT